MEQDEKMGSRQEISRLTEYMEWRKISQSPMPKDSHYVAQSEAEGIYTQIWT
ncbi:hypothetical protein P7H25_10195 [Paenibacillus larvae]|nr:hypothetical protein [Paenibacillus larvae]MDT2255936.1 hypothetical protein [Paenibacillus larvae]